MIKKNFFIKAKYPKSHACPNLTHVILRSNHTLKRWQRLE